MDDGSITSGEMGRAVVRIEQDIREVKSDVKALPNQFVPRTEYEARNLAVDAVLTDIKKVIESRAAMWPTWIASIAAVAAVVIGVVFH